MGPLDFLAYFMRNIGVRTAVKGFRCLMPSRLSVAYNASYRYRGEGGPHLAQIVHETNIVATEMAALVSAMARPAPPTSN